VLTNMSKLLSKSKELLAVPTSTISSENSFFYEKKAKSFFIS